MRQIFRFLTAVTVATILALFASTFTGPVPAGGTAPFGFALFAELCGNFSPAAYADDEEEGDEPESEEIEEPEDTPENEAEEGEPEVEPESEPEAQPEEGQEFEAESETATDESAPEETAGEDPETVEEPEVEVNVYPPFTRPVRQGIPEAFLLPPGFFSVAFLYRTFDEDSIASQGKIKSTGFRADYALNDRVQLGLRLWQNDTNNGRGIVSPFWNDTITADMWETDIKLFIAGTPRPAPGPIAPDQLPTAFSVGISHQDSTLSREQADDDLRILTGYVSYSAYLSPQLSTHTFFGTGRFTGDLQSGTMNTLAAGLDYDLMQERDKLRISIDGVLDIYNFRQTSFSATRVSHVNVGLKYMLMPQLEFAAGYGIHSDSDSDLSSTEFQFGLAYVFGGFWKGKSES